MFDKTNQTFVDTSDDTGFELPDSLFGEDEPADVSDAGKTTSADDAESENTEPAKEPEQTEPADEKPENQTEQAPQTIKVKYNGKEQELPLDEAVKLAQKGMNYDHVSEELQSLRSVIDAYAKASGMTREQYVEFLRENQAEYQRQQLRHELQDGNTEVPDALLDELAQGRAAREELEHLRKQEQEQQQAQEQQIKAWMALRERFPDVAIDKLPPDVYKAVENGMTPIEAYLDYQVRDAQLKLAALEKQKETKARAIGPLAEEGTPVTGDDPFLEGFNSV
jgi:hypothetical protein